MKTIGLSVFIVLISTLTIKAQLPPVAQALYTEMFNNNVTEGNYSVNNGAQVFPTADGKSFYLQWFPNATTPSTTPLVVMLHGTGSSAIASFSVWHQRALANGIGIIAIQYYRGASYTYPNDYFDDPTIYSYIDTALKRINYTTKKALLEGFSRGASRTYAVAFYDRPQVAGNGYFCTVISNSGSTYDTTSLYPTAQLYKNINNGVYGHALYNNYQWSMFSGGLDNKPGSNPTQMINAKNWVIANGGTVGLFIYDANLGHGGLDQVPAYIDSVINFYKSCYQAIGLNEINHQSKFLKIFPNPFSTQSTLQTNIEMNNVSVIICNLYGQTVREIKNITGQSLTLYRDNLAVGLYFIKLTENNKILFVDKLVITD